MSEIHILDSHTIDKIAAGEVVERPVSVVKELVENAIDAGAGKITVEIKDGGISLIRITDDGSGIEKKELSKAFMRHATSKIESAEDLAYVRSLGFRGEALSSISAVCQVELITKTREDLTGSRICVNGGAMEKPEEIGAPNGTTIVVRNIFFNTPVRRKFLKSAQTEGGYINDFMQHIALSVPGVAFQFIQNGQTKFHTSGNGNLSEVIYRIYGKDVSSQMVEISAQMEGASISGFVGKPILNRSNRAFETIFVNRRYVKSPILSSAVEEGYKTFLMQHKYPFVILHFDIDPKQIDVNVHPTKMDIRITNPKEILDFIKDSVQKAITGASLIQPMEKTFVGLHKPSKEEVASQKELTKVLPQPFEVERQKHLVKEEGHYTASVKPTALAKAVSDNRVSTDSKRVLDNSIMAGDKVVSENSVTIGSNGAEVSSTTAETKGFEVNLATTESKSVSVNPIISDSKKVSVNQTTEESKVVNNNQVTKEREPVPPKPQQLSLFDEVEIRQHQVENFQIIGQVFDTYWLISMGDKIFYVDQHAAHEKVNYERMVAHLHAKEEIPVQLLSPPLVVTLMPLEMQLVEKYKEYFEKIGFAIEEFGDDSYAIRSVPLDLYGNGEKELFLAILDDLKSEMSKKDHDNILLKIASMSCKAAIKGNQRISYEEARALLKELFACENPYNCPHGRPTMISMTRAELDKKFKRLV